MRAQGTPPLETLLQRVGSYVDAFDRLRGSQSNQLIEGRATYSNFRRFTVQSKTTIGS